MRQDLRNSNRRLHDSLFELYMQGGLELYLAGTRGLKRAAMSRKCRELVDADSVEFDLAS